MHLQTSRFVVNLSQPLHASDCKKFMGMIGEIISDSFDRTEEKDNKDALSASHLIGKLSVTEPENKTDTNDTKEASDVNNKKRVKEHEEKRVESEPSSSTS